MLLSKKLLANCNLYLILDTNVNRIEELFEIAKQSIEAGVDILQIRAKLLSDDEIRIFSQKIMPFVEASCYFIINDRVNLVESIPGIGLHVGQEDISYLEARQKLGEDPIIGVSCQTLDHLKVAQEQGADYVGFGSIFKTKTKPDRSSMEYGLLKEAVKCTQIPLFAIGGINLNRVDRLKDMGVKRFAICRAVCEEKNVFETVKKFKKAIET